MERQTQRILLADRCVARTAALGFICLVIALGSIPKTYAATITINGDQTYQLIDGFGVNANHRSWNGTELQPVLDALIDQAGMTQFRIVFDKTDWETTNDNADPASLNWGYYNSIYNSTDFNKLWDMIAFLNQRGLTNGIILNFQGGGPAWMGGGYLTPGMEDEWAEQVASLLYYGRNTRGLSFNLVSPSNEPDYFPEGIQMDASQHAIALHKLSQRLDALGMSDVRFIAPDVASGGTAYMPEMLADPLVMNKLKHWGLHSYSNGGGGTDGVLDYIHQSAYPDLNFWVTEFNVWCDTCDFGVRGTYDWEFCRGTAENLIGHLANGASGGIVWEGYDSEYYIHPPTTWSYWGLFSVDDENAATKTYTPRKNFYTVAQFSKFIRPGARRIDISGDTYPFWWMLAFYHSGLNQVSIVGINPLNQTQTLSGVLQSLPALTGLDLYYTSASVNMASGGRVPVEGGAFSATIPADCVFTLTGSIGSTQPALSSLSVSPASVVGGNSSTGTVLLTEPAPTGGASVVLTSSNTAATVPASVTIPAGGTSATFIITTKSVPSSTAVTLSATYSGTTRTVTLTVTAGQPSLVSLSLNPMSVTGGTSSTGTVTLNMPAPAGGVTIALSSGNGAAKVPASVKVAAGNTSAGFIVKTYAQTRLKTVTITARYGQVKRTAILTVRASR
jgi:O-glycosyl hydrolase